jgi:hypothetical protein
VAGAEVAGAAILDAVTGVAAGELETTVGAPLVGAPIVGAPIAGDAIGTAVAVARVAVAGVAPVLPVRAASPVTPVCASLLLAAAVDLVTSAGALITGAGAVVTGAGAVITDGATPVLRADAVVTGAGAVMTGAATPVLRAGAVATGAGLVTPALTTSGDPGVGGSGVGGIRVGGIRVAVCAPAPHCGASSRMSRAYILVDRRWGRIVPKTSTCCPTCVRASDGFPAITPTRRLSTGPPAVGSKMSRTNEFGLVVASRQPTTETFFDDGLLEPSPEFCAIAGSATPIAAARHTLVDTFRIM